MKCFKCGFEVGLEEQFCPNCGNDVTVVPADLQQPQVEVVEEQLITDVPVINNVVQSKVEVIGLDDDFKGNKSKSFNGKGLVAVLVLFVVVILAGYGFLKVFSKSPKNIFMVPINNVFESAKKELDINYNTVKGNMSFKVESQNGFSDMFKELSLNVSYGIDYKNKVMNMNLGSTYDSKNLLNGKISAQSNNLYVYVEEIFSKYFKISVEVDEFNQLFESGQSTKEAKVVIDRLQSAIQESLKDEYFTKEKATIIVAGKEIKVNKSTLILNDNNVKTLGKDLLTILKSDELFVANYSKIADMSKAKVESAIDDMLKELDDMEITNDVVEVSICTKGFIPEFVGLEITDNTEEANGFNFYVVSENNYEYSFSDGTDSFDGTVSITTTNNDFSIKIIVNSADDTITINISTSVQYDVEISKENVSNSVTLEELTDEDQTEIMQKLMDNELFQPIIMLFMGMNDEILEY